MTDVSRPRDLRVVASAIAVSAVGDWVALIALGLRANQLWMGGGVAVFLICLWSPLAVLSGHVGLIVDRLETRSLAIWSAVFQALIAVGLAFAHGFATILPLTVLLGAGVAVSGAAEFALIPLLAGKREIGQANGLVESMRGIGFVAGPAIGGLVAGGAGTRYAMLADAGTFLLIGAALATLPLRRRVVEAAGAPKPRARDGLTLLFADRILAIALGAGAVTLIFMSASIPADFAYAKNVLGVGDLAFGCVLTAWAVGMVAAANAIPRRIPLGAVATVTLLAAAVQGLGKFVAPFWLSYPFMLVCWTIGGMGHGVKNTGFRTLIHTRVEPARHGRAFAAFNGMRNTAELVALALGGGLVAALGGRGTLWIAGGVSALAAVVGLLALGRSASAASYAGSDPNYSPL